MGQEVGIGGDGRGLFSWANAANAMHQLPSFYYPLTFATFECSFRSLCSDLVPRAKNLQSRVTLSMRSHGDIAIEGRKRIALVPSPPVIDINGVFLHLFLLGFNIGLELLTGNPITRSLSETMQRCNQEGRGN